MTDIRKKLSSSRLYFDGGMGTLLQAKGLRAGELPELWNITHPDVITSIHLDYLNAGANILKTCTFGAYRTKFENYDEIIGAAIANAKRAVAVCASSEEKYIAFDMGPVGRMLKPLGDLDFEDAVEIFAASLRSAVKYGVDLVLIETMNDAYETKAAVLAAKETTDLPIFVTNAYDESGKLMTGADPEAMVALLEGLRVDALGINCSLGPKQMLPTVKKLLECSSLPVIVNPNAGLPRSENGKTVFDVSPADFSDIMTEIASLGASVLGGCCGTTPEYIRETVNKTRTLPYATPTKKSATLVSSYTHAVEIGSSPVLIGERINPTGKKRFKEALRCGDLDYIINEGLSEEDAGAHILDVNVGLPEIDETEMMLRVIKELQAVTALPLQIDTVDPSAMEKALRVYNGKPLINSVNGKEESLSQILPLAAKYGGVLIALTLDDSGIPKSAEGRLAIARKIVERAAEYGIDKKDIVVDPLAMAVSADKEGALVTLESIKLIKERLGVATSLGVSNISFGLPARDAVNAAFFSMALSAGLDCAIMNPHSEEMMKSYYAYRALSAKDDNFEEYIAFASTLSFESAKRATHASACSGASEDIPPLCRAIEKGIKDSAYTLAKELLKDTPPLELIDKFIIPSLDKVGKGFEEKTIFLPQLLMSAEAAKSAFEAVRESMTADSKGSYDKKIVLATVKGDIHDIGKNIVKVLLQNYGYHVIDLGKDVPPEEVCRAVLDNKVRLVGLSALMTTTVPAMHETIKQLRICSPETKIVVGGAVLTKEYADMIGANAYAKDAMQSVRYAEQVFEGV